MTRMQKIGQARLPLLLVLFVFFVAIAIVLAAPSWWYSREVIPDGGVTNDWAPATAGQLKHFAAKAQEELEENLSGGAGSAVSNLVAGFQNTYNFAGINLGQLKNVAKPYYDRLIVEGAATNYPWTTNTADDADFTPAKIGQIKYVFTFDLTLDSDSDGMPDWWEIKYSLNPQSPSYADGDPDGDALANVEEYQHWTSPLAADTDQDGFLDGEEVEIGSDPLNAADGGQMLEDARARIVFHWNFIYPQSLVFTNTPGSAADLQDMANALNALSGKFYRQVTP